jgi:hypothetical protein
LRRASLLLLAALTLACSCRGELSPGNGRATPRLVVPEQQASGTGPRVAPPAAPATASSPSPKVALGSGEKVIAVVDVNLNLERTDEQILITRDIGSSDERIRITVVEYDAVYQAYRRSWEELTSATDERYFTVSTADVVGDHSLEIVCQGATLDNKLTMDIYRRSVTAGTRLSYSLIFSAVAAGDIDIEEEARSQAYLAGDADGKPFAITVTEPDTQSPDGVDIVKTTHQWSTRDRRYVATAKSRIRGELVEREQLQALFASSSPDQYIQFLAGSWIRTAAGSQNDGTTVGELIRFLPKERTLQILSTQNRVQEEYTWDKTDSYYGNLMIRGARNTILPDITRNVRVNVQSLQQVLITVESTIDANDYWKATYRRVSEQALTRELAEPRRADPVMQPAGLYESKDGEQLMFQAPRFSWIRGDTTVTGGFYLYRLDRLVLGLLIDKGYGDRSEERAYIAAQSSRVESKRTVLTLTLQPAELTAYGARPLSEETLTFTQVQAPTAGQGQ